MKYYTLKTAFKNITKLKNNSLINLIGLSLSIGVTIIILLYVVHELSTDKFNEHYERMHVVTIDFEDGQQVSMTSGIGHTLSKEVPEIEKIVRTMRATETVVTYVDTKNSKEKTFTINRTIWADSTLFDIFSFEFIYGNKKIALEEPFNVVITDRLQQKIFGNNNPVGEIIKINGRNHTITGVIKYPGNSHIEFELVTPLSSLIEFYGNEYLTSYVGDWNQIHYVLLPKNADIPYIEDKITSIFKPIFPNVIDIPEDYFFQFKFVPLKQIYFSDVTHHNHGNMQFIQILIAISVLIIVTAYINFINLTTAKASLRTKEIGIKKVVGITRKQLIIMFILESIILTIMAMIIGFVFAEIFISTFNKIADTELKVKFFYLNLYPLYFLISAIFMGIISGIYPAIYLSSFDALKILKDFQIKTKRSGILRKGLMTLQFGIVIILIISAIVIQSQLQYVKTRDLGFRKKNIVVLHLRSNTYKDKDGFKSALQKKPNIVNISYSHGYPGTIMNNENFKHNGENVGFAAFGVDPEFKNVYDLKVIEGRFFDWESRSDQEQTCVLNESAVKAFQLENPVGTVFHRENLGSTIWPSKKVKIIGVVKDFHLESLKTEIRPTLFSWYEPAIWIANIQVSDQNFDATMRHIEKTWKEFEPDFPFDYKILERSFDSQYRGEERFGEYVKYLTLISILIATIGLFALISFLTEQRNKEFGIRKVHGASVQNLVLLISSETFKLIILASIIACPIAWYVMNIWLQNFAYYVKISWWIYLITIALTILITFATLIGQTLKIANQNPIDSIQYE